MPSCSERVHHVGWGHREGTAAPVIDAITDVVATTDTRGGRAPDCSHPFDAVGMTRPSPRTSPRRNPRPPASQVGHQPTLAVDSIAYSTSRSPCETANTAPFGGSDTPLRSSIPGHSCGGCQTPGHSGLYLAPAHQTIRETAQGRQLIAIELRYRDLAVGRNAATCWRQVDHVVDTCPVITPPGLFGASWTMLGYRGRLKAL